MHRPWTSERAAPLATIAAADRLGVRKTYKLYIGGEFPRTESGRAYEVFDARGRLLANACRGTRKDIRDAVRAARNAFPDWAARTAFNRSQILYRIAELMEGRRDQFIGEVMAAEGVGRQRATRLVDAAIDRWVWYAGWADKYGQTLGTVNPVNGSYFNFSVPEPTGVVGLIAPEESSLLGLVSRLAPIIVSGNCGGGDRLGDAAAAGGDADRGARHLRRPRRRGEPDHRAAPRAGAAPGRVTWTSTAWMPTAWTPAQGAAIEELAVENVKRLVRPASGGGRCHRLAQRPKAQSPYLIGEFVEIKTVWHPIGS